MEFYILFQQAIDNPLNTDYYLYMDSEGYQTFAQSSFAFMSFVFRLLQEQFFMLGTSLIIISEFLKDKVTRRIKIHI